MLLQNNGSAWDFGVKIDRNVQVPGYWFTLRAIASVKLTQILLEVFETVGMLQLIADRSDIQTLLCVPIINY